MMLIDSPVPELQLNFGLVLPVLGGFIAVAVLLIRLAVAAQRQAAFTGEKGILRQVGTALTAITPGEVGRVSAHGEIWNAPPRSPSASAHAFTSSVSMGSP